MPGAAQDTQQLDAAAVQTATLEAIAARMPALTDRVEVSVTRISAQPQGPGSLQVTLPERPAVPRGRMQVTLSVGPDAVGSAMIDVAHFDSVAVLAQPISSGDPVSPQDLIFIWMDVTRFSGDPLSARAMREMAGTDLIAHRSLRTDRPLRTSDLGPRPAADTGDPVRMSYRRGAFVLELACRARDRGQIGDIIRLYADESDTVYRARLTAPGKAEWIETL